MSNGVPKAVTGAFADLFEQRFEFGEGLLDRIEVGAVGWQVEQLGAAAFDRLLDAGNLVAGQIIHDDDIARAQGRSEDLPNIGAEDVAGQGTIEHVGGGDAGSAQASHQGGGFPVTMQHRGEQTQAAGAPAEPPGHVGCRRGLVEEHQALRIESGLAPDEGVASLGYVRTLLLGGVQTFF